MATVVTGAAGFIGRHVTAALTAAGHPVVGIDRRPWAPSGERVLVADLADDVAEVRAVLGRADAVVHLAGRPGVRGDAADLERARHRDNVVAGERVLAAVPDATPLVVASSSSVYGGAGSPTAPTPSVESDPLAPRGGYARSKVALEDRCRVRAERGGQVCIVRPFTVAGEGQRPDMAIARWLAATAAGSSATVLGGPDRRRDITDVREVARGILAVLERGVTGTLNLGTGATHRLDEVLTVVGEVLGVPPRVTVVPASADEPAATCAGTTRCAALLGFVPTTDLGDLVARQAVAASHRVLAPVA